jgi:hypothetical protein
VSLSGLRAYDNIRACKRFAPCGDHSKSIRDYVTFRIILCLAPLQFRTQNSDVGIASFFAALLDSRFEVCDRLVKFIQRVRRALNDVGTRSRPAFVSANGFFMSIKLLVKERK